MDNIFDRGGLQQETGVLPPHYLQDGSTYVCETYTNVDDEVIFTVSTNKKFYMSGIVIQDAGAYIYLYDGTSVADPKAVAGGFGPQLYEFASPIVFENAIYCACTENADFVTIIGWEE